MFQTLKELFNTCIVLRIGKQNHLGFPSLYLTASMTVNSQDEWKTKSIEVSRRWIPASFTTFNWETHN
jgi:hypothetical protein